MGKVKLWGAELQPRPCPDSSSCKQGPSCWHNELSWWAGGFLQQLGLKISCWLKEAFGEMYRTLWLWIIFEIYLFSIQIGKWSFMHLGVQQKPVPFTYPSAGCREGELKKVNNSTSPVHSKRPCCEGYSELVLHLSAVFWPSRLTVKGQMWNNHGLKRKVYITIGLRKSRVHHSQSNYWRSSYKNEPA